MHFDAVEGRPALKHNPRLGFKGISEMENRD
jgi:hypothetical protein